jgi:hypothetical protein
MGNVCKEVHKLTSSQISEITHTKGDADSSDANTTAHETIVAPVAEAPSTEQAFVHTSSWTDKKIWN